jgi:aerobic-type carbon monoxide dehydrogenase small subunit (CoxS/CutS family)
MHTDAPAFQITINRKPVIVTAGTSVAAALLNAGAVIFRRSVTGEPRLPLCGMGICLECRVTIDGRPHQKSCQLPVQPGMEVLTDE